MVNCTSLFKRQVLNKICISILCCLDRSVSRAMGCFVGCFRVRDDHDRRTSRRGAVLLSVPDKSRSNPPEAVVSKNRLSALFLSEERGESLGDCVQTVGVALGSPRIDKELKNEAKFLKACGTLPETPGEIRKACQKSETSPSSEKGRGPVEFNSWLPTASVTELKLHKQTDQPLTPVKLHEELKNDAISSERTPSSCLSNVQNTFEETGTRSPNTAIKVQAISSNEHLADEVNTKVADSAPNVQYTGKLVRYECDSDISSCKGSSFGTGFQNVKELESPGDLSVSRPSVRPTPLKLADDMQTPGTVYPSKVDFLANGKARFRSQHVHSVSNPSEDASQSQWKVLEEEESSTQQLSDEVKESLERDRPIIGMVAAHWNENEQTHVSPKKKWDGNGIPNSTNKYKEDQKVSWHATPFEERLEKALSEESLMSQRKQLNPIAFNETEESDTALSKLHAPAQSQSVVSF